MPPVTESLFLDKLQLVAGQPLTYVAFLMIVVGWGLRWYFLRTVNYLKSLPDLPERDRLSAFQVAVLGFPNNLTENRLRLLNTRYVVACYIATLVAIIILAGLLVHYYSMPAAELRRTVKKIEDNSAKSVAIGTRTEGKVDDILKRISTNSNTLSARLDAEKNRGIERTIALFNVSEKAIELSQYDQSINNISQELRTQIESFERDFKGYHLTPSEKEILERARRVVDRSEFVIVSDEKTKTFIWPESRGETPKWAELPPGKVSLPKGKYLVAIVGPDNPRIPYYFKLNVTADLHGRSLRVLGGRLE